MQIDIQTQMITLLGTPLSQSFAARMQNTGYAAAGMNLQYFYTETDQTHLGDIVNGLRYMNFAGFAVTKPNKVAVLQYLDELDPLCEKMGSCNTVVRTQTGKLIGYNTDGVGFYKSLTDEGGVSVRDNTFFVFGCGGAGRAIASVLAYHGAKKLYITDAVAEAAKALEKDLTERFGANVQLVPYQTYDQVAEAAVLINASGIGMGKTVGQTILPPQYLQPTHFCFDACYNPDKTQFLLDAEAAGCATLNGLGMSLYQGAAQIELWTGQPAPVQAMRSELLRILAEQNT